MIFRELIASEFESARELFQSVFKKEALASWWTWKYKGQGLLDSVNFGAFDSSGRLRAHVGALVSVARDPSKSGKSDHRRRSERDPLLLPTVMIQVCDVMVEEALRGQRSNGLLYRDLMREFASLLTLRWPGGFAYGFPGKRPHRLGERLGFYQPLATYGLSPWQPNQEFIKPLGWTELFDRIQDLRNVHQSFAGGARDRLSVERSVDFLAWRYQRHPELAYSAWGFYQRSWFGKKFVGWIITRPWEGDKKLVVDGWLRGAGLMPATPQVEPMKQDDWVIWAPDPVGETNPIIAVQFRYRGDFSLQVGVDRLGRVRKSRFDQVRFTAGDTDVF
ncbi:MAG: hypothetical protein EBV49_15375 [Betaproteobacteria bacterium]|nr:hypothetical protein [Betaproteobacteria bacterium]